jgi:hypothetical protein
MLKFTTHVVCSCRPSDKFFVCILPAGPQRELDIWPVFEALPDLLVCPDASVSVHVLLVGPDVPDGMHNRTQLLGAPVKYHLNAVINANA